MNKEISDLLPYEKYEFLTAIFLAMILWRIRTYIISDRRVVDPSKKPDFSIYMCVPGTFYDQKDPVWIGNHMALTEADQLFGCLDESYFEQNRIPIGHAFACWKKVSQLRTVVDFSEAHKTQIYPEVSAEIASFLLSKPENGHYALVDIGAGTVDISLFMISEVQMVRKAPVLWSEWFPLGVEELEKCLMEDIKDDSRARFKQEFDRQKQLNGGNSKGFFPSFIGILEALCNRENVLESYVDRIGTRLYRTCIESRKKTYNNIWGRIQILIGGGGSYLRRISDIKAMAPQGSFIQRIEIGELAIPSDFNIDLMKNVPFHRLSVAYGLSRGLDRQSMPNEIPEPIKYIHKVLEMDRDEKYPK
jgi:hypothetical protein